ncbi:MAG: efflux RND transporter permease subunit, partial [Shimia sp.]
MNRLIEGALATRVFPNLLMVALLVAGLFSLGAITVKNFPEISTGVVQVQVIYPGATPQEVSDAILEPIENKIRSTKGIRKITATAGSSVGTVIVSLTRGTDVREALDDIQNDVDEITIFPDGAEEPRVTEVEPAELAIQYVLSGDLPRATLKDLAEGLRDDLQALGTISSVEVAGVPPDEIGIEVPGDVLRAYEIGLPEFAQRVGGASLDLSGGVLQSAEARVQVRTVGQEEEGAGFARLAFLAAPSGATVPLADIAEIEDGLAEEPVQATLDGAPAVFVSVFRTGDEQLLAVVDATKAYIEDAFAPRMPDTVRVTEWRNEAVSLEGRIALLSKNAAIGAALILLILALILDLRIAFWVAAGIVISFVGTFALMQVFGITINQLSLFGFILALGIVVDDAIVVGESVFSARQDGAQGIEAAQAGATRVARPILYAVATTILAFLPLLYLPGAAGSFISPVAAVVIMVLALSLVESFLILPQHLAHIRTGDPRKFSPRRLSDAARRGVGGRIDRFADTRLRAAVGYAVRRPLVIVAGAVGLLFASLSLLSSGTTKFTFFPEIEGEFLTANLELPEGTALARTEVRAEALLAALDRATRRLAAEIGADPEAVV